MNRPSSTQPTVETGIRHSSLSAPSHDVHRASVPCDSGNASLVDSLFASGSPSAIGRLVIAVIVDPVKRMCGCGPRSHVVGEGDVRVPPALAHGNASPAISGEAGVVRSFTSVDHVGPHPVVSLSRLTVRGASGGELFSVETTTRTGSGQVGRLDRGFRAAFAAAQIAWMLRVGWVALVGKNRQASMHGSGSNLHGSILPYFAFYSRLEIV